MACIGQCMACTASALSVVCSVVVHHVPNPVSATRPQVGQGLRALELLGHARGLRYDEPDNYRDALFLGACDDGVRRLAGLLGWSAELDALVAANGSAWPAPGPDPELGPLAGPAAERPPPPPAEAAAAAEEEAADRTAAWQTPPAAKAASFSSGLVAAAAAEPPPAEPLADLESPKAERNGV